MDRKGFLSDALIGFSIILLVVPFILMLFSIPNTNRILTAILDGYIWYSLMVITFMFLGAAADFEVRANNTDTASLALMTAFIAAARVPFAAIPGVQPCTMLIFTYGWVFGPKRGMLIGAMVALVSNIFLGQGLWTLWQMGGWALVGLVGGMLAPIGINWRKTHGILVLSMLMFALGLLFGLVVDISSAIFLDSYILALIASLPFDLMHAVGNVLFFLTMGPYVKEELERARDTRSVVWNKY